jgi:putative transposase
LPERAKTIHVQGLRYLSLTLAAYVSEEATIRFDPRDVGEIWLFYNHRFVCRAISLRVTPKFVYTRLAGARPDM